MDLKSLAEVDVVVLAVFASGNPTVIADLWPHITNVKWIHSLAAGVDTLVPVLNSLPGGPEIPLTNAKGAFSRSLAEYSLAAMLHFNKQIPRLQSNRVTKTWDKFIMNELHGQTVGFIGFGDIAQCTARLCKAFGMKILAWRNTRGAPGEELADKVFYSSDGASAKQAGTLRFVQWLAWLEPSSCDLLDSLPGCLQAVRLCDLHAARQCCNIPLLR